MIDGLYISVIFFTHFFLKKSISQRSNIHRIINLDNVKRLQKQGLSLVTLALKADTLSS